MTPGQVSIIVVGAIFTIAQTMSLFVLRDLRERIMRLENRAMGKEVHVFSKHAQG